MVTEAETTGIVLTVTGKVAVVAQDAAPGFVAVKVYVVFAVGLKVTEVPLVSDTPKAGVHLYVA